MDGVSSEREEIAAETADPKLVAVLESPVSEAKQATASLRTDWRFAASVLLLRQLALPLRLNRLSIDQLEQALVKPTTHLAFTAELLCKLAWPTADQSLLGKDFQGWNEVLKERMEAIYKDSTAPEMHQSWQEMIPKTRLMVLHDLCERKTQELDGRDVQKGPCLADAVETLRKHEIGFDASERRYYHMSSKGEDSRIYTSKLLHQTDEPETWQWTTLCVTLSEVQALAKRFEGSQHDGERLLYNRLTGDILPAIQERSGKFQERIQIEADAAADRSGRQVDHLSRPFNTSAEPSKPCIWREEAVNGQPNGGSFKEHMPQEAITGTAPTANGVRSVSHSAQSQEEVKPEQVQVKGEGTSSYGTQQEAMSEPNLDTSLTAGGESATDVHSNLAETEPQDNVPSNPVIPTQNPMEMALTPRKRQFEPGWSPLGFEVPIKPRKLETKPMPDCQPLVAALKGRGEMSLKRSRLPLPSKVQEALHSQRQLQTLQSDDISSGSMPPSRGLTSRHKPVPEVREYLQEEAENAEDDGDQPQPSRSGPRAHLTRHRPSRKRKEMDDADYEQESESEYSDSDMSEPEHRPRANKRSQASKAAAAAASRRRQQLLQQQQQQSQAASASAGMQLSVDQEYHRHAKNLQEHEKQQRAAIAMRFPSGDPQREFYMAKLTDQLEKRLVELKQWYARKKQEERHLSQNMRQLNPTARGDDLRKEQIRQQEYNRQKAQFSQVVAGLSAEERLKLSRLSRDEQYRYLEIMTREREQRMIAEAQKQALSKLGPEQMHQLNSLPEDRKKETVARLTGQFLSQQQEHAKQQQLLQQRQQQQQQQQQQMFGGQAMQDPFFGDMQMARMGSHSSLPSPAASLPQQRSPSVRASPGIGGSLLSNPSLRAESSLGLGMDPQSTAYNLQGGVSRGWGATSSSPMSMRFPGMIPNDHSRGVGGLQGLQRPGSATPSDLGPGVHDQMLSASSHPMQQFRGVKMNPLQQGMIPTNMPTQNGPEMLNLHRLSSSGGSFQGSGSLHGSPSVQRLGSTGGLPSGPGPAGIMRRGSQQQPGINPFTQGPGQMSQGHMSQLQMSQGLRMDPSASPHQQRDPAMFQRSFSPAVGGLNMHGQGGMMPGGLMSNAMSAQQMSQGLGMQPMGEAGIQGWQQMRQNSEPEGGHTGQGEAPQASVSNNTLQGQEGAGPQGIPQKQAEEAANPSAAGELKDIDGPDFPADHDNDFVDFAETFLSPEAFSERHQEGPQAHTSEQMPGVSSVPAPPEGQPGMQEGLQNPHDDVQPSKLHGNSDPAANQVGDPSQGRVAGNVGHESQPDPQPPM